MGFLLREAKERRDREARSPRQRRIWSSGSGLDADNKLAISWYVGSRDSEAAMTFIGDLTPRLASRVQLTSDGHKPYLEAIETAFSGNIDYAMLVKIFPVPRPKASAAIARPFALVRTAIASKGGPTRSTFQRRMLSGKI